MGQIELSGQEFEDRLGESELTEVKSGMRGRLSNARCCFKN